MFQSTQFAIENRPGLEDQNLDNAMTTLRRLEAPSLLPGSESFKKTELATWLSDWHLVSFLQTTQLFSPVIPSHSNTLSSHVLIIKPLTGGYQGFHAYCIFTPPSGGCQEH